MNSMFPDILHTFIHFPRYLLYCFNWGMFDFQKSLPFLQQAEIGFGPGFIMGLLWGSCRAILSLTFGPIFWRIPYFSPQQNFLQNYSRGVYGQSHTFLSTFLAKLVAWGASSLLPNSVRVANFSMQWSRCRLGKSLFRSFDWGFWQGYSGSHTIFSVIFGHLSLVVPTFDPSTISDINYQVCIFGCFQK